MTSVYSIETHHDGLIAVVGSLKKAAQKLEVLAPISAKEIEAQLRQARKEAVEGGFLMTASIDTGLYEMAHVREFEV